MPTPIQEFRRQYPQYNDYSDEALAEAIRMKHYPDADPQFFREVVGLKPPKPEPPTTIADRIDRKLVQPEAKDPLADEPEEDSGLASLARRGFNQVNKLAETIADTPTGNAIALATERASSLLGHAIRGAGRPIRGALDKWGVGTVVIGNDWGPDDPDDGKFRVRYMHRHEVEQLKNSRNLGTDVLPEYLTGQDLGVEEWGSTEAVKEEFFQGNVMGTMGEVLKFGTQEGIRSVPDMIGSVFALPAYVVARSDEIGMERAHNKGMDAAGMREQLEALPAALGSALFERYGVKKIKDAFGASTVDKLGADLLQAGLANVAKRVSKKAGAAAGWEAGTEFFQEGVIEYLGEKLGTDAPMSWAEAAERGLFGAIGGGTAGGIGGGTGAGMGELQLRGVRQQLREQFEQETPKQPIYPDPTEEPAVTEPGEAPAPRETDREPAQPDPADPDYFDVRLKREDFRVNLARMADELLPGGNVSPILDENERIVGRTPSINPPWFQTMNEEGDFQMSVNDVRNAVEKALTGQRLGVRQARVVGYMLDSVTDARVDPENLEYARELLEQGREARRRARQDAARDIGQELPPLEAYEQDMAGELFEETEYLPEMDGEARIAYELTAQLDELGAGDLADMILLEAQTTQEAIRELEKLRYEQQAAAPGAQTETSQQGQQPQAESQEAAAGPALDPLLELSEDEFISALNPAGEQISEEDRVVLDPGDLDRPMENLELSGSFQDNQGNQVELRSDPGDGALLAVRDGQVVGEISPEGEEGTAIMVTDSAQGQGIGSNLAAAYLERNPGMQAGGFSPAGEAAFRSAYRLLKEKRPLQLEQQTEETFRQQSEQERQREAQEREADARAAADAERGAFALTGSNLPADEAAARGQGDLLGMQAPERRQDIARRERIASMSPDQVIQEVYTDPLTGLGNERAFNEDLQDAAAVGSIDVDGLGAVNDHLGHDSGDAMLRAVGEALKKTGAEAYHKSGDEFYVLGDSEHDVAAAIRQAEKDLAVQVLESDKGKINQIRFTSGVGPTKATADSQMEALKKQREAQGLRSPKGQLPPGGVLNSQRPLNMGAGSNYVPTIGMHGELPLTPDNEYQLGNGKTVRIPAQPVRRRHIVQLLERKFGTKIYSGRVKGPKTRLGFYRQGIGEIRTRKKDDLEVTAHEVAHWLDDRYPWIRELYQQFEDEIRSVSYDDTKDFEGYAEFMRLWFTKEHEAREGAPGFYDAWMAALDQHKGIGDTAMELQELMHAWYLQGARARLDDRFKANNLPNKIRSLQERMRAAKKQAGDYYLQKVFDELRSFKRAERAIRGGVGKVVESGYNSLRLARGAYAVMQGVFYRGTVNWNEDGDMEFTGKGLQEIFDPVSDRMDNMQAYMVARRARELTEQGRENHVRPDEIAIGLQLGEQDPQLKEVFEEWLQFNGRMMDFYQSSGLLNQETRDAIEEMNRDYVPFNRIVDTFNGERVKRGGGSPFVRLRGGTSNINDVFDNIMANTARMVQMALINKGKQSFYQMIDRADNQEAAMFAVPIAKDTKPTKVTSDQVLRSVVEAMGLDMRWYRMAQTGMVSSEEELQLVMTIDKMAAGLEPMVTFFQFGQDPQGNVDFYYEDGQKKFYEIADPLLWDSIQHLGPRSFNLAAAMLGGFSNMLRRGVTLTPTFQSKNFIRDTMNAFTLSKGHIVPAAGATKALVERLYNDHHYWEYMINGGGFAAMAEADGINRDRVIDTPSAALRLFDRGLSAFEYANRIAEYKALREKGWSARDAALAGREISSDFAMRGSSEILRWITLSVPFMNARLQGLYRNGRELAELEEGKVNFLGKQAMSYSLRSLMAITIPSVVLYLMNKDDERYQEMPDWIRDQSWVIFTGEGEDDYVMIPKPFETGMLWGTLPERTMEYMYTHDEKELADAMGWMMMETFALNPIPQAYQPLRELQMNRNWTGAPIIPEYLQDVEPMEQYRAYTSDAMVALGRKMNISPIKAEHLVRGYMGTWGGYFLGMGDMLVGDVTNSGAEPTKSWKDNLLLDPFVNDGPLRRTRSENDLYDLLKDTREIVNTVRIITNRSPERLEGYVSDARRQVMMGLNQNLEQWAASMREVKNAIDMVENDPELSGDEKREQIFELQRQSNEIARQVRQNIDPEFVQELLDQAEAAEIASRGNQRGN